MMLHGGELPRMVPIKDVQPFSCTEDFLQGCRKIQEAKHQAIAPDDVKELLTAINKKHLIEIGTWEHDALATPSQRLIARCFGFAAEELNVKLSNGVV
jgi:hypothetical protein